ncbi:putative amidase [Aspergillus campestris IBT 28561]|uniref:Amidase n=1 Tax=Aspergillus campestris (strain IBT 28561) TaxID=1392248 RepID=A0A2I1CXK6_ASPC2|nr:putative amidase [Aspergillus campestris IBT 28561]PKY02366.1 putative amidase [Aspergillus campestris IBT 28561]
MRLCTVTLLAAAVVGTTIPDGQTLTLNDIPYFLSGIPVSRFQYDLVDSPFPFSPSDGTGMVPLTVLSVNATTQLDSVLASFRHEDDVFQDAFLGAVYLASSHQGDNGLPMDDFMLTLQSVGMETLLAGPGVVAGPWVSANLTMGLSPGPYFVSQHTGQVFRAYRLYPDHNMAFVQATISDEKGGFMAFPAITENAMTKDVAVPSRLYSTPTREQPLAGLRVGVKDIFHIKGLRTSGGSRSYYFLYGRQNVTASSIQRLIDLGAVVVGKTGTVQFSTGDRPTADWVDFHCPFNPRGDGYQAPGGSSSGSGAAIASYEWLDLAVGSDTGGSVRFPAALQGVYGNRPSTGAISLDHVLPLSPLLDTAGMLARHSGLWARTVQSWYPNFERNYTSFPRQLLLADDGWDGAGMSPHAHHLLTRFADRLEGFLQVPRTLVNIQQRWRDTHASAPLELNHLLNETYAIITAVDQYNRLAKPLYADYASRYDGRRPFINPGPRYRWQWGQDRGGDAAYEVALRNMTIFREWWETLGFGRSDEASCSEALVVSMFSSGEVDYRDEYYESTVSPPFGWSTDYASVMAGAPEVVVPLGEIPYQSAITLHEEYLPVTAALQMARGCDHVLADLVAALGEKGILQSRLEAIVFLD